MGLPMAEHIAAADREMAVVDLTPAATAAFNARLAALGAGLALARRPPPAPSCSSCGAPWRRASSRATGRAAPSRIGPTVHALPRDDLQHVEEDVRGVQVRADQDIGLAGEAALRQVAACG